MEDAEFERHVAEVDQWWACRRWQLTKRPQSAREVCRLRGTLPQHYASSEQATKLWRLLKQSHANGMCSRMFGALNPVQVGQMAEYLDIIYVSGPPATSPDPTLQTARWTTSPDKVEHQGTYLGSIL